MANPKGMRNRSIPLKEGGQVMIYSSSDQLVLQLRLDVPTEADILRPSFKTALELTYDEALLVAAELLQVASAHIGQKKKIENQLESTAPL